MKRYIFLCLALGIAHTSHAQTVGTIYRLVATGTNKAMTTAGNGELRAPILLGDRDEADKSQLWALISTNANSENYGFYNIGTQKSIDMALQNNGKLLQWKTDLDNTNQIFTLHSPGIAGSAMQLLCASDPTKAVTRNAQDELWMKSDLNDTLTYFELEEVMSPMECTMPVPYRTYQIVSHTSGKALSNKGNMNNDAAITTEAPSDDAHGQMWQLYLPNLTNNYVNWYQLFNKSCGKCIDAALDNKKTLLQWTQDKNLTNPNYNQLFQFVEVDGQTDTYQIMVARKSGSTLTYYYIAANASGRTYIADAGDSQDTWFRLNPVSDNKLPKGLYWQDETIYEENKEPGHATYMPYESTAALRADQRYTKAWLDPTGSQRWMSLNGTWKLKWNTLDTQYTMPQEDFYGDSVDASSWDDITVPGCLEMQGYGKPLYINVDYAFQDAPPYINMKSGLDNSVGSYRRSFTLPQEWSGERILLHFDGIYSAAYVWVNGQWVGYTQGGNMDAEFDITRHVRQGDNNLSVRVIRWSDGSYLEGQDMWHMSGIHRDVYLVAVPRTFVRDHHLQATLDRTSTSGSLDVHLDIDNRDSLTTTKHYEVRLISPSGQLLQTIVQSVSLEGETAKTITITLDNLTGLQPWTSDAPHLYTVEIVQRDSEGREECAMATRYGFCQATIQNQQFLINGRRVLLKGVNTQDTHPLTGRTIDTETMWQDLVMMKQANVNTVRASHYPRNPRLNAMMDHLGLYLMDEADVEFHKNWNDGGKIHTSASWRAPIVDRVERMVLRDRNHPCIVSWSLGNESNGGTNFTHAYNAARALDPRPIHYEGASRAGTQPSDIYSVMYRDVPTVEANVDRKGQPYFMCEYAHAMGHSVGNLKEYWDVMEASRNGMGGCIWDWVDQSIVDAQDIKNGLLTSGGFNKYRQGADYGGPHQGNFVNNGILTADRRPNGKWAEVRRIYQYVKFGTFYPASQSLTITNQYESLNLEGMPLKWTVLHEGQAIEQGTITLPSIPAGSKLNLTIPYTALEGKGEYLLNVALCLNDNTDWAESGYALASRQYVLTEREALPTITLGEPLTRTEEGTNIEVSNANLRIVFSPKGITSWTAGGIDVIPSRPSASTSPTYSNYRWIENDAPYGTDPNYATDNGITQTTRTTEGNTIVYTSTGSLCNTVMRYTPHTDGSVDLEATYTVTGANLRRIGMAMQFNPQLSQTRYYARGPWDNTVDRKQGADLGIYSQSVRDFHIDYARPQTSGDRQDLRWLELTDAEGQGIRIETEGEVHLTLDNWDDATKHQYTHQWDMPASERIHANFDAAQRGIGNGSCGAGVLDQYLLPSSGTYTYRLRFSPLKGTDTGIEPVPSLPHTSVPAIYTLSGQRVSTTTKLPKGIYIIDGKKIVVKGH